MTAIDAADERVRNVRLDVTYDTIQDAIDEATDGDVIAVRAGSYCETLRCDRSLTIEAIGDGVAVVMPPPNWNALVAYGDHKITMKGLAIYLLGTSTLAVSDRATISIIGCSVRGEGEATLGDLGARAQLRIVGTAISGLGPLAVEASPVALAVA
ncbi:MAG: hypothetical protein SGJ13_13215 [Actinomycetota bacterium]|nr:hypothetical protein [Actinomycetota bacterium]